MNILTQEQVLRNGSSVKNLGKTENIGTEVQFAVLGDTLDVANGNLQMTIFVICVCEVNIKN